MTDTAKPSWPKLDDGTTDWEAVFEDPHAGLISVIGQAQTASAMRQCTVLVIEQLHTRKNDPEIVANFIAQLDAMVPDDTPAERLPKIRDAITGVLRQIKDDRIAKAEAHATAKAAEPSEDAPSFGEEHLDEQAAEAAEFSHEDERRQDSDTEIPEFVVDRPAPPRYALFGGIGAGVIAAMVALFYIFLVPSEPSDTDTYKTFVRQMETAAEGQGPDEHVFGGAISVGSMAGRKAVTAHSIPGGACQSVAWSLANKGNVMISGVMPKRVQPPVLKELCTKSLLGATLVWIPRK